MNSPQKEEHRMQEDALEPRENSDAWAEERRHYKKIVNTFRRYSEHAMEKLVKTSEYMKILPLHHQTLLRQYKRHLRDVKKCIEGNQSICMLMILEESHLFENQDDVYPRKKMKNQQPHPPTNFDFDKVQAVFKQISRDWSVEGKMERESCYKPIVEEVERIFEGVEPQDRRSIKILVPGAGLGRLAYELVFRGFAVEGNEFSLFMLFASNFLLNKCTERNQFTIFPWIHQTTNVLNCSDQIRPLQFPDLCPTDLPENSKFSMTAGDFIEVYSTPSNKSAWDAVTTCFFIDCASNIVSFLESIHYCLKDGGVWVNIGPLLYHFADMPGEPSIEPSWDLLREIVIGVGFTIEKEETNKPTYYAENKLSMLSYTYKSLFFVCKKVVRTTV